MTPPAPLFKHQADVQGIIAGDKCQLWQLLHPAHDAVQLDYSIAYAKVEVSGRTLNHVLHQSEVYYVIRGEGLMYLDGVAYAVRSGSCYYIPPRCEQWLQNTGETDFEFICIVNPPWQAQQEEILE
jgi:mannose-6-phosphate isomerase-like protein (cupin superfamily)